MFKVMTLNVNAYFERQAPWPVRLGLIREVIENACPDILALQAVRQDPALFQGEDQAAQLANLFPVYEHVYFQPAMFFADGSTEGSAFISRTPFSKKDHLPLPLRPSLDDNMQHALLHVELDLDTGRIHLYNAYVSWVPEQARENMAQILSYVQSHQGAALMVGDFNNPPDSDIFIELRQAGWSDMWMDMYPSEDGFTFFEGGNLVKRIDYAWANQVMKAKVRGIRIVAGEDASIYARPSDHEGLLITCALQDHPGRPC